MITFIKLKNEMMDLTKISLKFIIISGFVSMISCIRPVSYYSTVDFSAVPKIDVHFHYFTTDLRYLDFADSLNFRLLSPNVDTEIPIDDQYRISKIVQEARPAEFAFLCTFSVDSFGTPGFIPATITRIKESMKQGASGVKIWKNIGMELRDTAGRYILADDPAFGPIFQYLDKNKIPVLAHLGEPRDCWLPLQEMTDGGDKIYYANHPQYHMYLHPGMPTYEDQINARDRLLGKFPDLNLTGAHLGSLEWNVDELAKRLDRFPNFNVDMAARIGHLKNQSKENRERVRRFLITYQERILYATDLELFDNAGKNFTDVKREIFNSWMADWIYLASDSICNGIQGLQLPKKVINKIYCENAERIYRIQKKKQ